jgi:hypothetical protein
MGIGGQLRETSRKQRRRWLFVAGLTQVYLCLTVIEHPAHAEFNGEFYSIERPKLGVDMSYRFESEERRGPFSNSKNDSHVLREGFDLETEGWLYHPAMAIYTLSFSPEWEQTEDKPDPGQERDSDSFFLGYGIDTTLLPYKPYTLNLYARRQSSELDSSLATRSESESDAYGASLRLKYPVLPTILSYDHSTSEQTGFYDAQQKRDEVRLIMRHERESNDTQLNSSYVTVDWTNPVSTTNTENLFGSVVNNYRLTPDKRVLLTSRLTYRQSENNFSEASGVTLSEVLNWRHRVNFSSNYNLRYSQDDNNGQSINRTMARAGLSHSLYENLVSTAAVSASSDSQGEDSYGGNAGFSYRRSIPWGMIFANMGHDYRITNRSRGDEDVQVINERHVLTTGDVTLLDNRNVDLGTVVVTNGDGSIVYTLNLDYTLEVIDTSVRLSRTTFGSIGDGQSVLVDYTYLSDPAFDDSVYIQDYGIGLFLWSAWRINYRYSHAKQDFRGGIPPDVLTDDTTHFVDTDLKWKWSTTRALYENTDRTSGTSVSRWRIEENLNFRPSNMTSLGASTYYGETTIKDTNSEETFYGFRTVLQWQLSGRSRVKIEGLYDVTEGASVNTVDKGAEALWEWVYGIWRAEASYRFLNEEDRDSGQIRDRHSIFFNIRRALF